MSRLRMIDIAAHCGVSKAAVVRALNRPVERSELRPETWQRIRDAARDLGYRSDWRGRALAGGRSHTIGLLYDGIYPPLHAMPGRLVAEIARFLAEHGYDLLLVPTDREGWRAKLEDRRCDAVVVVGAVPDAVEQERSLPLPMVVVNAATRHNTPRVEPDDEAGSALAVQHLLDLGHRRIAFCHGEPGQRRRGHQSLAARERSYRLLMRSAGHAMQWISGDGELEAALTTPAIRPSAIIAYNDGIAARCLQIAYRIGLRVPDDLSLVAFNDDPEARMLSPPLTTLAIPLQAMGQAAADLLMACLGSEAPEHDIVRIAEELVIRASTAAPA
jgi:LacI family transcriptional regulator